MQLGSVYWTLPCSIKIKLEDQPMTKRGTFKGNPTLTIQGEFTDLTFGLTKARLILANLAAVQKFVNDFTTKPRKPVIQVPVASIGLDDILDLPPVGC